MNSPLAQNGILIAWHKGKEKKKKKLNLGRW
jgi:hypothetical protein